MKKFFDFLRKSISSYIIGFLGLFLLSVSWYLNIIDFDSIFSGTALTIFVLLIVSEFIDFIVKRNSPPSGEDK